MFIYCILCLRLCYFVYWMWFVFVEKSYICERKCYEGFCGLCDLIIELICRCIKFKKEFFCIEVMKLKGIGEFTNLIWKKVNYFIKKNLRICL